VDGCAGLGDARLSPGEEGVAEAGGQAPGEHRGVELDRGGTAGEGEAEHHVDAAQVGEGARVEGARLVDAAGDRGEHRREGEAGVDGGGALDPEEPQIDGARGGSWGQAMAAGATLRRDGRGRDEGGEQCGEGAAAGQVPASGRGWQSVGGRYAGTSRRRASLTWLSSMMRRIVAAPGVGTRGRAGLR